MKIEFQVETCGRFVTIMLLDQIDDVTEQFTEQVNTSALDDRWKRKLRTKNN